jgi:GTPase
MSGPSGPSDGAEWGPKGPPRATSEGGSGGTKSRRTMFVDEVDIHVAAGHGGRGAMSFRREKFVPRGGPNGGDGGPGGSVYVTANANLNTLLNYRFQKEFAADRGAHGEGSNRTGRKGADIELEVPIGTVIYEKQGDELVQVADLTALGERVLVAKGGLGGRGNAQFATSTNRAPRRAEPGLPGEEKDLRLHLKLLADVGLVGFPNAGKSTMIARISAARPKIADYPFTTLSPNLGVVGLSGDRTFVVADVPGLIEGAHTGHGLGHRFLSHLERTKVLVHLVDVSSASGRDPVEDFGVIVKELALFPGRDASGEQLKDKPMLIAANKIDALDEPDRLVRLREHVEDRGLRLYPVSAATGEGIPALLEAVWRELAGRDGVPSSPVSSGSPASRAAGA